jgi:murein DD-endopeptidase MepM/ murein hydrolase activator NlpD
MAVKEFVAPTIDSDSVDLRSAPSPNAEVIVGKLNKGVRLELAQRGGDWHACRVYLSAQVARVVDGPFVEMIPSPGRDWVNIRRAPDAQDVTTDVGDLKPGQRLEFIAQEGGWLVARAYVSAGHTQVVVEGVPIANAFSPPIGTPEEHAAWFAHPTADRMKWPGAWFDVTPYGSHYQLWNNGPWAYHTGADLNLPKQGEIQVDYGKPCFAPAAGIVRAARKKEKGTWGKLVVIEHRLPDGMRVWSRLAHLLDMQVTEGEMVERGQPVGHVGDADGKLKSHLHFDIAKIDLGRPWQPAPPGQPDPRDPAGDWPGDGEAAKQRVANDYLDPRAFILQHPPQT